ncbi:MAG: hypothetical protein ACLGI8_03025 [Acidimicrobiia bacterium]|jgi:hypothetical protein
MPVAQSRGHAGKALLVAGVGVVVALGIAWFVAQAASRGDVEIRLGDDRFDAGQVESIAEAIDDEDGLPVLVPDLVGGQRNLFVQHLSEDADEGWVAFGAFDPDDPSCAVQIDRDAKVLVNACDESVTYPLDGAGLRYYPTSVEDGRIYVDINELSTTTTR